MYHVCIKYFHAIGLKGIRFRLKKLLDFPFVTVSLKLHDENLPAM